MATTEVAETLAGCPGVLEACVYGVGVPGAEGRAGMAAIVTDEDFDLAALHAHLAARLPAYARPVFLRCVASLAATETFKLKKQVLVDEGYDPARVEDLLYIDLQGSYAGLDRTLFAAVQAGAVRL